MAPSYPADAPTVAAAQSQKRIVPAHRVHLLAALAAATLSIAIFLPPLLSEAAYGNDYRFHIEFAEDLVKTGHLVTPHFLFQALLGGAMAAFANEPSAYLAALIGVLAYGVLGATLCAMLFPVFRAVTSQWAALSATLASLCIIMLGPVNLLSLNSASLMVYNGAYLGYLAPDSFHSPTIILLRPFALGLFLVTLRLFVPGCKASPLFIAAAAGLSILALLAKPSFTICLLPCLCLVAIYSFLKRRNFDWRLLMLGIVLPSLLVLGWQYAWAYSGDPGYWGAASHVIFAPLLVYDAYASNLLGHFLASILFPLLVTHLYWNHAKRDPQLLFAWGLFAVGCLYTYLLAEEGPQLNSGNFTWSGQITAFLLLASSVLFFVRQFKSTGDGKGNGRREDNSDLAAQGDTPLKRSSRTAAIACAVALALHLAGGLYLYGLAMAQPW